ncbi:MAG: type II 3-dehydroquinate dehydratase [Bacteroidales bacterium]
MKILIINGPNINLIGKREPELYGHKSFESYLDSLREMFPDVHIDHFQSNIEGEIIDSIQQAAGKYDALVLNAGGYTHTSVAIGDAVRAVSIPVTEVHITNIFIRESYRHISFVAPAAKGSITGFGLDGYRLAVLSLTGG